MAAKMIHNPKIEPICTVGDPMMITWKESKTYTVFRGSKPDRFVLAEIQTSSRQAVMQLDQPGYILVDIPIVNGKPMLFEFNAILMVRFLAAGVVYSFRSSFLRVHSKASLIVLEYPRTLERHNLRAAERMDIMMPVGVGVPGGEAQGALVDISTNGAMFAFEPSVELQVGEGVKASFTLPDGMAVAGMPVTVRNRRNEHEKAFYGVSFGTDVSRELLAVKAFYSEYVKFAESIG